jgi:hypothetical protein
MLLVGAHVIIVQVIRRSSAISTSPKGQHRRRGQNAKSS